MSAASGFPYGFVKPTGRAALKGCMCSFTGPASYSAPGFEVEVRYLKQVYKAMVVAGNGYMAEARGVYENRVLVAVYQFNYGAGSPGPAVEVPDGTDLSSVEFQLVVVGE